jgi:hypothetical protein
MERVIAKYAALALAAAVGFAGYNWICWSALTAADWGTWFGAVGTIGALIGTIWLATRESQKRHHDEMAFATVAAASLLFRVLHISSSLQCAIRLLDVESGIVTSPNFAACARSVQNLNLWTTADITPLVCLGHDVAAKLMMVAGQLPGHVAQITQMDEGISSGRIVHTGGVEAAVIRQLSRAKLTLEEVEIDLTRHLKANNFIGG